MKGQLKFLTLVLVPQCDPFDILETKKKRNSIKFYVHCVFIIDDCYELMLEWLNLVKDFMDEPETEIDKNQFESNELTTNLNVQLDVMRTPKVKYIVKLSDAVVNPASNQTKQSTRIPAPVRCTAGGENSRSRLNCKSPS